MASPDSPLKVAPPEAETLRDELAQVYSANSVSAKKLPVDSADSTAPLAADPASLAGEFLSESPAVDNSHMQGAALKAYGTHTRKDREDKMILDFLPMVYKIVHKVVSYLHPPLSKDDLVSAGTIGLVKAARDFKPDKDAEFKTYAYIRVRGAVIDELRSWSFTPTSLKKQFNLAQQLLEEMTEQMGQAPSDEQLAEALGMTTEKMYQMFENARARHFMSIHGLNDESPALGASLAATGTEAPSDRMEFEELKGKLARAIADLPDKQRRIVVLYYQQDLTMKEIAEVLEVTESRVSQLHASSMFKLSGKLKLYREGF